MENWLVQLRKKTKFKLLRVTITVAIVFLTLAGLIALAGDLGLGNEIAKYRIIIWISLLIGSAILVLGYKLSQYFKQNATYAESIRSLENELNEARQREQSLLRLMETYKSASYTEIFTHLKRLIILVENKQKWHDSGARVKRIRIQNNAGTDEIIAHLALWVRVELIINIGKPHNVTEGMEFLVRDENIPNVYGVIMVKEAFEEGSICTFVEEPNHNFWNSAFNHLIEDQDRIIPMQDNCLEPNLPAAFDNITAELAKEFQVVVERIAYSQQGGETK